MPASGDLCSLLISWLTCWLDIHTTACVIQLGCANYKTDKRFFIIFVYIYTYIYIYIYTYTYTYIHIFAPNLQM